MIPAKVFIKGYATGGYTMEMIPVSNRRKTRGDLAIEIYGATLEGRG